MNTKRSNMLKKYKLLSVLTLAIGIVLLIFMIIVEHEPGAIPLLLIVLGTGGYLITRAKLRKLPTMP